ncbi:hypothetical protein RB5878 [Rhodopirellula baltica SH 1]|uniref:Uncharacterized protein n=1 Tax=Rhodopirellula baltica (strain DSM 10527 / NCIMB 13988 / SH1) TaxID=243090 RepID=Q7UR54_RHOBA|nr:hypothetical protein RB5878 [Rhodopirellula baltica SH 1]
MKTQFRFPEVGFVDTTIKGIDAIALVLELTKTTLPQSGKRAERL